MKRSRKSDEIEKMILKRMPCRKRAEIGNGKEDSKQVKKGGKGRRRRGSQLDVTKEMIGEKRRVEESRVNKRREGRQRK